MTVEEAIERLEEEFHRKYPGYQEARDRVARARKALDAAKLEETQAFEALRSETNRNDEYLLGSLRGVKEALGMKL